MAAENTRPVGTAEVYRHSLAAAQTDEATEAMAALHTNRRLARRIAFDGRPRCSYVSVISDRQCPHRAAFGQPFCKVHARICRTRLKKYQQACGKEATSDARKQELYHGASQVVHALFGSRANAKHAIEASQDAVPVRGSGRDRVPLPLHDFESLSRPLRDRYEALADDERERVRDLVDQMYDSWRHCWLERFWYRKSCEAGQQDVGHVWAYYLFKAATLAGKVVRDDDARRAPTVSAAV